MKHLSRRFLPAVLLAAACLYTYKLELPETHAYPATGINALSADTKNGDVTVTAATDTTITVGVLKSAYGRDKADAEKAITNVAFSDAIVGGELTLKADMPSGPRPYGASFTITARESTDLALSTTNGDVKVSSTSGTISATTTNRRSREKSGHFPISCVSGENPEPVTGLSHGDWRVTIADFRLADD